MDKKQSTKRLKPAFVGWSVEASVTDAMREDINDIMQYTFSDAAFAALNEAIACCQGTWRGRTKAPRRANVHKLLVEICETANHLRELIFPYFDEARRADEGEKGYQIRMREIVDAREAARRFGSSPLWSESKEEEDESEQVVVARAQAAVRAKAALNSTLHLVSAISKHEAVRVAEVPTLTQGGDSTHWDSLLKDIFLFLKCYGPRSGHRRVHIAEIAKVLLPLLSDIPRPSLYQLDRKVRKKHGEWVRDWDNNKKTE